MNSGDGLIFSMDLVGRATPARNTRLGVLELVRGGEGFGLGWTAVKHGAETAMTYRYTKQVDAPE